MTDAWQRRGVATQLMQAIADLCEAPRIERFEGQVLAENKRMLDLCRWLKFDLGPSSEGSHVVTASKKL